MLLGKGVMINWSDCAPEHRAAYDAWHCHEHSVGRVALPGFCRGRRYIAAQAQRDFLTMYEVEDFSALVSPEYQAKVNNPSPLTRATGKLLTNAIRGLTRVQASCGDATGGCALTLRFDPVVGRESTLNDYLANEALPRIVKRPDMCGAHLLVTDVASSKVTPVERQGRPTAVPNWVVMLEGFTLAADNNAADAELAEATLAAHGAAPGIVRDTYTLQFLVPKRMA